MQVVRLIIDTDTASDDAVALLMAFKWPSAVVDAVTIVAGNVEFEQQVRNALYVVEQFAGGEVPIYLGCRRPLLRTWRHVHEVHGRDGMGNSFFPKPSIQPEREHAVNAIVELVSSRPGEYTIIALGPLTNIALACRLDEELPKKVKRLYVMGGSVSCQGNITPVAEYNFWVDPDAAHIVLQSGLRPLLVGWDVVLRAGMLYEEEWQMASGWRTKPAEFFSKVTRRLLEHSKSRGVGALHLPDPLSVAAALNPSVMTEVKPMLVVVDRSDSVMRGASIGIEGRDPNADVCQAADNILFKNMLYGVLRSE